jgi:hypothetical protein
VDSIGVGSDKNTCPNGFGDLAGLFLLFRGRHTVISLQFGYYRASRRHLVEDRDSRTTERYSEPFIISEGHCVGPSTQHRDNSLNLLRSACCIRSYPIVNSICILPLSIVNWSEFNGSSAYKVMIFIADANFYLSGLYNVLLFLYTRPGLLLFAPTSPMQGNNPRVRADMEIGGLIVPVQDGWNLPKPAQVHGRGLRV